MLASYGLHAGLFRAKFHACTPNRLIDWLIDFSADPLLPPLSHLIFPLSIRSWPVANQNLTGFIRRRHLRAEFATISRKNRRQSGRRFVWPAASYCEKRNEPAGNWERDGIRRWDTRNSQRPRIFYLDFSGLLVFLASTGSFPLILSPSWLL